MLWRGPLISACQMTFLVGMLHGKTAFTLHEVGLTECLIKSCYIIVLGLSFPIYKMGIIIVTFLVILRIQ